MEFVAIFKEHFSELEDPRVQNENVRHVFSVKGNHKTLENALDTIFKQADAIDFQNMVYDTHETVDGDHGRQHWHVENKLHWCLDIAFNEDRSRIRKGHSAENFAIIKRVAINLIKQETSVKVGIKNRRKCAGWNSEYLFKVLSRLADLSNDK